MTPSEWADVLAGLHDSHKERGVALLQMTDEDWISQQNREWLRERVRSDNPVPRPQEFPSPYLPTGEITGYYWLCKDSQQTVVYFEIPFRFLSSFDADKKHPSYSINYPTVQKAWLALLEGMK